MTSTQILVATFTIAFEGLMMLQSETSEYRHFAIVDGSDHYHEARVEIWHYPFKDAPDITQILKEKDRVTFEDPSNNVLRGKIETDKLYEAHVPHLPKHIANGDVHDYVVQGKETPGVLAYVDLPGGWMTTFDTFRDPVRLTKSFARTKKTCFARFGVLEAATNASDPYLVITHADQQPDRYPIKEGDLVIVSNISAVPKDHFHLYAKLLTAGGTLRSSKVLYNQKPSCVSEASQDTRTDVKIVLLKLKTRVPNGDCGPVNNP